MCHGYTVEEVAEQAAVQAVLHRQGFSGACGAIALTAGGHVAVTPDGKAAILLTFVEGKAADAVVEAGVNAGGVMQEVGAHLAELHQVVVPEDATLRSFKAGGCCLLGMHVAGECLQKMRSCEHTAKHPFVDFYEGRLATLQQCVAVEGLPHGILHGDPFLDNVLVDEHDGTFRGFVDFEDACVGPLLFDMACAAIGCCYRAEDNALDLPRLEALMEGYVAVRRLAPPEWNNFHMFMMVALLCNCSWRFMNFNIDHREIEDCRNTYMELQQRIQSLEV